MTYLISREFRRALFKEVQASVFSYMSTALIISGVLAWWFGTDMSLQAWLRHSDANGIGGPTLLGWVVMFAPLVLVFVMGGMVQRLSSTVMLGIFLDDPRTREEFIKLISAKLH